MRIPTEWENPLEKKKVFKNVEGEKQRKVGFQKRIRRPNQKKRLSVKIEKNLGGKKNGPELAWSGGGSVKKKERTTNTTYLVTGTGRKRRGRL